MLYWRRGVMSVPFDYAQGTDNTVIERSRNDRSMRMHKIFPYFGGAGMVVFLSLIFYNFAATCCKHDISIARGNAPGRRDAG